MPAPQSDPIADAPLPRATLVMLSDARLGVAILREARYLALRRAFGVSRSQANLLTFVLLLGGASAAAGTAKRIREAPFPLAGTDALIGGFVMREAGFGVAGPAARETPLLGTLLAIAMVGGLVAPELQRTIRGLRAAERRFLVAAGRFRQQRTQIYAAARQRASQVADALSDDAPA